MTVKQVYIWVAAILLAGMITTIALLTSLPSSSNETQQLANGNTLYEIPPLKIVGKSILDSRRNPIHLHCVNWAGGHTEEYLSFGMEYQSASVLADFIVKAGFNCVRLQFSAEMVRKNPIILESLLEKSNPDLVGSTAMQVFERVVKELTDRLILVILDMHQLDAKWCCSQTDENGGWYNDRWSEEQVTTEMTRMVSAFASNPYVVGVDLRNEIRSSVQQRNGVRQVAFYPNWGLGGKNDWVLAAERLGNAILQIDPSLLIFVGGIFARFPQQDPNDLNLLGGNQEVSGVIQSLEGVRERNVTLSINDRLIYSNHDYSWFYALDFSSDKKTTYERFREEAEKRYGFISDDQPFWLGEFGTANDLYSLHFQYLLRYIKEKKFHWAVWEFSGDERRHGINKYAIMNKEHSEFANQTYLDSLRAVMF